MRGPAWATLGTACSQVRWQEPPITTRSPWPISTDDRLAAAARAQGEPARVADGDDRDHGVLAPAAADGVAVPGDAVAPVAVVAAAGGHERLAELGAVVLRERVAGLGRGPGGGAARRRRRCAPAGARRPRGRTSAAARPATARRAPGWRRPRRPAAASCGSTSTQAPRVSRRRSMPSSGGDRRAPGASKSVPWKSMRPSYDTIEQMFELGLGESVGGGSGVPGGDSRWHPVGGSRNAGAMTVTTPPSTTGYAARVRNLTKTYGTGQALVRALDDVTLDLARGSSPRSWARAARASRR